MTSLKLYWWRMLTWDSYEVAAHQHRYAIYEVQPTWWWEYPPEQATPATPHLLDDQTMIILFLPVHKYAEPKPKPTSPSGLLQRLITPPDKWETELWHCITPHAPMHTLKNTLASGNHMLVCSNAILNPAKFSTFAWIIHSVQTLWSGKGIIPGHLKDVYSGWSEAFGILTGLCFFLNYTAHFPLAYTNGIPIILILCDGKSILDQLTRLKNATIISSQDTIANDNNVYLEIIHTIQQLKPFHIKLVYVRGHQDHLRKKKLTLAKQLNVECDHRASDYLVVTRSTPPWPNPMLPGGYPHLMI